MGFKIDYRLEDIDVRNLEFIAQTNGNLQVLRMNRDWSTILENKTRIAEAVGSIGIEGTVLSIEEAQAITSGDRSVRIGEKERREFEAYFDTLQFIRGELDEELTSGLLLKIHEKITRGDEKASPGKIRTEQNYIKRNGEVVFTPPPEQQLGFLLKEFITWFNQASDDKYMSPILAGAICHFWFVWIHPFTDGNGRTARVLTTFLLLKKKSEGAKYFSLSDYYNRNQESYYQSLELANTCNPKQPAMNYAGDLGPWIKFFIESYLAQTKIVEEITNRILQLNIRVDHLRKSKQITVQQEKVLELLYSSEKASYEELEKHLGKTKVRVNQILKPLRSAGILVEQKIGKNMWFRLGSPEDEPDESILKKKFNSKIKRTIAAPEENTIKQASLPIFDF